MSQLLPTIWMNITTSANWQRPPVGIVRVERSLCSELEKLYGSQFKLCIWRDGVFIEWVPQLGNEKEISRPPATEPKTRSQELPLIFPLLPRRQALKAIGQGLLSLLPSRIRPYFNRFLYQVRPRLTHILTSEWFSWIKKHIHRQVPPITQSGSQKQLSSKKAQPFSPGDVLISIGLDWGQQYCRDYYFLRKTYQIKIVTCCYDLIPVIYPQYCVGEVAEIFTSYFLDVADGSDLVLCISKQSEKDFIEMLDRTGGARPRTHVFPLGDNVPVAEIERISPDIENICKEQFILFVSTIERRKNHEVLYRAYHLLCREGKREKLPKLLFVGMQGWGVGDLLKDIELDPLTRGRIVSFNHVTDTELRILYESAKFCVFPSLYEGWGLPVGEALSLGKAVICSDRGSLPEVGGELVRYVDPWNPRAWADEIYQMGTDDDWRSQWEQKAKAQYKVRTWDMAGASVKNAIDLTLTEMPLPEQLA